MSQVHIFVSYSHDDARWFADDKLMPRLIKSLEIIGAEVWYDHRRLGGGDPWKQEIVDAIKKAHIAILLVSRNFLNSDFIREIEIPRIERRFDQGELIVVPILVGHCNWQNVRMLSRPQMVPGKPTPLISYLDSPAEWDRVQEEIFSAIERQVERVRDKYHLQAPVRQESTFDASATITRLSGALPKIPVVNLPDDAHREHREAPSRREPERRESSRRASPELDTHNRPVKAAVPKKTSSFVKTGVMYASAMVLAAVATAGLLVYGPFGGDAASSHETVQASETAPTNSPAAPQAVAPASPPIAPQANSPGAAPVNQIVPATVAPAVVPSSNGSEPNSPMPVSTPGVAPAPSVTVPQNPVTPAPNVTPAPTSNDVTVPDQPASVSPATPAQAKPAPKPVVKPTPVKKPAPKPVQPAPTPQPKKTEDIIKDAAVDILVEKLKR
ncbi:MAG: TIR domain-containing protein [Candidatus Hydrogenedentes bacterium]|nr:TIR domain-containing protein [Candidatus Hydrogenedentota bacterium]